MQAGDPMAPAPAGGATAHGEGPLQVITLSEAADPARQAPEEPRPEMYAPAGAKGHERSDPGSAGSERSTKEVQPQVTTVSNGGKECRRTEEKEEGDEDGMGTNELTLSRTHQSSMSRTLILTLAFLPTLLLYILIFTEIGYGATVYKALAKDWYWTEVFGGVGMSILFFLYIFDFTYWTGPVARLVRVAGIIVVIVSTCVSVALTFTQRPYAPILAYFVGCCLYFTAIYSRFFKRRGVMVVSYVHSLSFAVLIGGCAGMVTSLVWAGLNNFWWGQASQVEFRDRLRVCTNATGVCRQYGTTGTACSVGCEEVFDESACIPSEPTCLAAMLLWASLFIVSLMTIIIGGSMYMITSSVVTLGKPGASLQELKGSANSKMFTYVLIVLILILWVAASIGGASMDLSNVVTAFAGTGIVLLLCLLVATVGWSSLKGKASSTPVYQKLQNMRSSDWLKALCVQSFFVLLPIFFVVSFVNQLIRKTKWLNFTKELSEADSHLRLTAFGSKLLDTIKTWNWSSVLSKVILVGFAYFVLQVGVGKITTLFLAWLNQTLAESNMHIGVTIAIVYAIGIILFLIPAVPGVPVYVANGVILGAAGQTAFGSFWAAMALAVLIAFVTKISACIMQQKLIGERLGGMISVRSTIGVNSKLIKAIRLMLQDPAMTSGKVLILVGGPDWPTSVTTGILRQKVSKMMIGTTPIILPIALTVIAGGCMLRVAEGGIWVSLGSLFMTLSAASLGGAGVGAMLAIERVINERKAEIDAIPDDEEVKRRDEIKERQAEVLKEVKHWNATPLGFKILLVIAGAMMYAGTVLFLLAGDKCFESIDLTTSYQAPPLNGNLLNMVKRWLGWIAIGLEGGSLVLYYAYGFWAKRKCRKLLKERHATIDEMNATFNAEEGKVGGQAKEGETGKPKATYADSNAVHSFGSSGTSPENGHDRSGPPPPEPAGLSQSAALPQDA
mmetsp:Transcript_42477/g.104111  ORF Transcript_42477/g.104111 Transcript_42477/m.104111 type:complete len:956 (-) Transcript_42477:224-3091(-)|eukprot:CAMPEP_0206282274 /NCGR_PEP_ID=MMETSP0047_2-20121206/39600_1 /ASSEMBLY_ACC=CAM_ASM_000192 /TAXON_ID=195065 /ORGANISM="Chroomonas mesostigmatica_cf, Strain CCMP1168" /LENGTH=955 /DNA_ID=CAMNT_0053712543 /DNA_START=235 /DNA_END=3102 /DNA_ORIENTATION=+